MHRALRGAAHPNLKSQIVTSSFRRAGELVQAGKTVADGGEGAIEEGFAGGAALAQLFEELELMPQLGADPKGAEGDCLAKVYGCLDEWGDPWEMAAERSGES